MLQIQKDSLKKQRLSELSIGTIFRVDSNYGIKVGLKSYEGIDATKITAITLRGDDWWDTDFEVDEVFKEGTQFTYYDNN